ncbi:unnamed protein product [Tuber melanosporum]|uniref:(Perigord truffle) hypothetical protein n=1 Tax=Tuber melanosporum (strain Mel28) TaxID=656061 RepID=D5GJB7_TUBMM|nr:uncharacterized protein GSTUM_00008927001 [Tuber melanosporum]CAZ84610.1 unnamed protein product [Tuber melanosporum]
MRSSGLPGEDWGRSEGRTGGLRLSPEEMLEYAHIVVGEENICQTPVRLMILLSLDTCQLYKLFSARYAYGALFVGLLEIVNSGRVLHSSEHIEYSEGMKNRVHEY